MDENTLSLLDDELKTRLARQRESASRIDTKATALLTLLLASVPLGLWNEWSWHLLPARLLVAVAAVFALRVITVRPSWEAPIPRALVEKYASKPKVEVLGALVGTRVEVFERNAKIYDRKAKQWRNSAALIPTAAAAAVIGIVVDNWR